MNEVHTWADVEDGIATAIGRSFRIDQRRAAAGGGCINAAWTIEGGGGRFFLKLNDASRAGMFEAEASGLAELRGANAVRVPQPICHGANAEASWIVLEHIELRSRTVASDGALGAQLAQLHQHTADEYGGVRDNTIGSTRQPNPRTSEWPGFWRDHRLGFQLGLARENGCPGKLQARGELLLDQVPGFFIGYTPSPSLLHGDLWSGNAAADNTGAPVIFDPAVYYGDREADVAMTELFDGFAPSFYAAYREAYPLDAGYTVRKDLYNLYHVLNHLNLFGGSYLRQAEQMIDGLLAHVLPYGRRR